MSVDVYFSDYFGVAEETLDQHGALNVSLINDLPLFIDPFLLYASDDPEFQAQHDQVVRYVVFLKELALRRTLTPEDLKRWFYFPEVKENWLGFSVTGNRGSGLGRDFARALSRGLATTFRDFGEEQVTDASHLEKLCLIKDGVGRDNISDLTTNLIKPFLLAYTQAFAAQHLRPDQVRTFTVPRAYFDYTRRTWMPKRHTLPAFQGSFVLLTPRAMLTREQVWINRGDLLDQFADIVDATDNAVLRATYSDLLISLIREKGAASKADLTELSADVIERHPEVLDAYIKRKEEQGKQAKQVSESRVRDVESFYIEGVDQFVRQLDAETAFYRTGRTTREEALQRVQFLKDVIENKDGHRIFYNQGKPVTREEDVQILFRLTWFGTPSDLNREVNNGRGPADFTVSRGRRDKTVVEFKLAKNSQLRKNLVHQTKIYERASDAQVSIKVIVHFSAQEQRTVEQLLKELKLDQDPTVVLIDASNDKPSASKAKASD